MCAFVWLLQALVASAAGVYLNTPCIRSLVKCAPFQLSLSDGKFSNNFIEDPTTLNRQCRSIGPLLECMEEAVSRQCSSNISPAEKDFIKTRLFIAEVCKDVDYTQKVYLRNAACINRERDWVIQACNPYDYVQLVNTSNLISLEGSCLFQKLLINCRQDAILDKCGPDAADLYQRVKAVDMNVDFLCLESRDLRSPKFMLDVVLNSYISLLLETLRPVLIMESFYLKEIVEVKREEESPTSPTSVCSGSNCPLKRAKRPAHFVQDVAEYKWRRSGDIPLETSTESTNEEPNTDSVDEEYFPVPSVVTDPVDVVATDPANVEAGGDSGLAVEDSSSNSDGIVETTEHDLKRHPSTESSEVEEEASSDPIEHLNSYSAESELEQTSYSFDESNTRVVLGIPIPQFVHAEVDGTLDLKDVPDAASTDLGTIQGIAMHNPSGLETTTDFDEFQGMATLCPEYLEAAAPNVDDAQESTTQYPSDHETSTGTVQDATFHSGDREASSVDLDDVQETTILYTNNLETITDDLEVLFLMPTDGHKDAAAESNAFIKETTTLYPSEDLKVTRPESGVNEENIFGTTSPPDTSKANFGEEASPSGSGFPQSIKNIVDFVSNTHDDVDIKDFLEYWVKRVESEEYKTREDMREKIVTEFALNLLKLFWIKLSKNNESSGAEPSTSDASKILQATCRDTSGVEECTSNAKDLETATTENGSLEEKERIEAPKRNDDFEKEFDGYITSTLFSSVTNVLVSMFAPKEMERRSVGLPPYLDADTIDYMKSKSLRFNQVHGHLSTAEFIAALKKLSDGAVAGETERSKGCASHRDDVNIPKERSVTGLASIKSIAELGVKLNYVLIGEGYVPLEVGYGEGNEERKSNRNLKIPRRMFKFYTSTPTEQSSQIPECSESSTTGYTPDPGELPQISEDSESSTTGYTPDPSELPQISEGSESSTTGYTPDPSELPQISEDSESSTNIPDPSELPQIPEDFESSTTEYLPHPSELPQIPEDSESSATEDFPDLSELPQIAESSEFSTTEYLPEPSTEEPESFSSDDPEKKSRMEDCFSVLESELGDGSEFSTTEYHPEPSTEEPESFSNEEKLGSNEISPDFSCPEVAGNQTPRISHLVDPEKKLRIEDCFDVLREKTQSAGESSTSEEDELPNENPEETNQEFRRSGDIEERPEKVDLRNLDLETIVALKFYGEVLTELAAMLPSGNPDSKTLTKRASALAEVYENYQRANLETDPSETTRMAIDELESGSRRFQKRSLSLSAECAAQKKPVDGECKKSKTDDGVRFDIGYTPESYIRLEMSYPAANNRKDTYVPEADYILMGETRLPLELHFSYKNVNYVHYTQINIPKRSVDLKDTIALDEV